uniref:Uncharacterized protein n=1 Tax=Arundo donax TaxID=35708 RepID=A0A0A9AYA1_ARUDO
MATVQLRVYYICISQDLSNFLQKSYNYICPQSEKTRHLLSKSTLDLHGF